MTNQERQGHIQLCVRGVDFSTQPTLPPSSSSSSFSTRCRDTRARPPTAREVITTVRTRVQLLIDEVLLMKRSCQSLQLLNRSPR